MGVFAPIRDYVETLVHPSAQGDVLTAARHRAFIAPRLIGGIIALACVPAYLIVRGAPSGGELIAFAWLLMPIVSACFLSYTGRYEAAHVLSSLALTVLVTGIAATTGGIDSFAAIWLAIVPLEAAFSASRRVLATAAAAALGAAGLLFVLTASDLLPRMADPGHTALATFGIVSAVLYAAGLGLGAEALARATSCRLDAEADRSRLFAGNMIDVVTRYGGDGDVMFVSPAAEALFGTPLSALYGRGLFERVHVADRPAYLKALGDAAALAESRSVELRVRREGAGADGRAAAQFAWVEMRCRPLEGTSSRLGANGRREVVAVLRDMSRRKQQEQALEEARAEAERANIRKSRFLATMSHELRTPLNAIIGFSEMLIQESSLFLDATRRIEYATLINDSGKHLLSVVNGILDMSKIDTDNFELTPEPFAPGQVIAACCELVALRARDVGVLIESAVPDELPDIVADKRALNQILLNLLSNAIRFCERGGKVVVRARVEAPSMVFCVEDDGVGIGEEDLARVGEPYFQARSTYERRHAGTGLGLSIVKGLVRLHGGEFSIRSRVGEGTRVTVYLPLDCERSAQTMAVSAQMAGGDAAGELRVLRSLAAAPAAHELMPIDPPAAAESVNNPVRKRA